MIHMLATLQRLAEQCGDGLLPELADRLRVAPRLGDGGLITIDEDAEDQRGQKGVDKLEERREHKRA